MDDLIADMLSKNLITVEDVGLNELRDAVDHLLKVSDYTDLLLISEEFRPVFFQRDSVDEPGQLAAGCYDCEADENWWGIKDFLRRN